MLFCFDLFELSAHDTRANNNEKKISLFGSCLLRFANNMVYVGLSYYGPALGNEEHLSFFFSSLAEIPSYMACWVVMDRWGRRWPLCLCMVVAGVSCIATVLLSSGTLTLTDGSNDDATVSLAL